MGRRPSRPLRRELFNAREGNWPADSDSKVVCEQKWEGRRDLQDQGISHGHKRIQGEGLPNEFHRYGAVPVVQQELPAHTLISRSFRF